MKMRLTLRNLLRKLRPRNRIVNVCQEALAAVSAAYEERIAIESKARQESEEDLRNAQFAIRGANNVLDTYGMANPDAALWDKAHIVTGKLELKLERTKEALVEIRKHLTHGVILTAGHGEVSQVYYPHLTGS